MSEPYEIMIAPLEAYLAPVGETFPDVDTTPAGNWVLLGTNGEINMEESGVMVSHQQTIQKKRTLGSTGPVKVVRPEEDIILSMTLYDLTAEEYAKVLNGKTVTDVAAGSGTPGYRHISMRQGKDVQLYALLLRGTASPYGDAMNVQYEFPVCYQSANPEPVFNKADMAGLKCEFTVIEDPNAVSEETRMGRYVAQDAVALA
jgi:hypothetical protein